MKINETELFNEITSEADYSLYDKTDMPLYKDTYFCKIMYCPKTMTLEKAKELYDEIADEEIEKLSERPIERPEDLNK